MSFLTSFSTAKKAPLLCQKNYRKVGKFAFNLYTEGKIFGRKNTK